MGEQKLFQEEIYRLNREISRFRSLRENAPPVILTASNTLDRTINYFPVREDACNRWSLDKEKRAIESFLSRNDEGFKKFLLYYEEGIEDRGDDLHSHLIYLYNHFPVDPTLFLDGITRRFLPEFIRNGKLMRYAFVNLLPKKNADYNYFPWVEIKFFHTYPPDQNPAIAAWADQESTRVEKYEKWFDRDYGPLENAIMGGTRSKAEGFQLEPFFFEYLQPFFMGYEKGGEIFSGEDVFPLKDQDLASLEHLLIIPFYDAWIDGNPCGSLKGNLLIPFEGDPDYRKRTEFVETQFGRFTDWSCTLNQLLFESRSHQLLRLPVEFGDDPLKEFLSKIALVQEWETARIFHKGYSGYELEGCFKRKRGGNLEYQMPWMECKDGNCRECLPENLRGMLHDKGKRDGTAESDFYAGVKIDLQDLLDPKILPSVQPADLAFFANREIYFEWPETVYLPDGIKNQRGIEKLRDYYKEQMIPVLDRVIQKSKILRHSVRTAVSAIISRNHSHHIGSHVTPRVGINRIRTRLKELGTHVADSESWFNVLDLLKDRLDEYIQKKADFMAEISTEPLTTTKTVSLFSGVLLPFIGNTLLMDNLGANEGVNYRTSTGENRLKVHVHNEGKELNAEFGGGSACGCLTRFNHTRYPYSASCTCANPKPLQVVVPEFNDISVALPGPLGEFALYCFLENFVRNSVKHNSGRFRQDASLDLNVHISISDQGDPGFYKVDVWDDVTPPGGDLKEHLRKLIDEPIVDTYGQLRKGGWGVAEMKIMACLLEGCGDLSRMNSSLKVSCDKVLSYEFSMMKPREVAVISRDRPEGWSQGAKGVWWFASLQEYKDQLARAKSPASFHVAVIDEPETAPMMYRGLLPFRMLATHTALTPGAVAIDGEFMESIRNSPPEEIVSLCWRRWVEGLGGDDQTKKEKRLALFFSQEKDMRSTKEWLHQGELWERGDRPVRLSVIYQGDDDNEVRPPLSGKEDLFVFDRHFDGYPCLRARDRITFHEMFDKNSSDYTAIFSSIPSESLVYELAESALLRVLILDERVAEVAYDEIMENKPECMQLYGSRNRIVASRWANLFIATHVKVNDGKPEAIHQKADEKEPRITMEIRTGSKGVEGVDVVWYNGGQDQVKLSPHAIIVHLGLLDGFLREALSKGHGRKGSITMESFLSGLREHVPFIAVDSGRGIPASLPKDTKFFPFSLVEENIMKERISKHALTRMLMSLTRRGNR